MIIKIITLFPEMFDKVFSQSIVNRAQETKKADITIYNLRDWANDKHKTVDDSPYGGGAGMILKPDIVDRALLKLNKHKDHKIILLTPQGKRFTQSLAYKLSINKKIILICGHYGGFDERIRNLVDMEISLGDFVLTGGEIPAMAIVDALVRLVPNVINIQSLKNETHSKRGHKQFPQYTRPEIFTPTSKKLSPLIVPPQLLSGNHKIIEEWRINR